ncbi:transporter substrate-binding domain-containing protein [Methylobrevis pamukkalensis]|uniref:transporter substrate-binding domain-containing protein n=1 Tax=Methylobrevis pamukkalensis TaxID=1439726 RepID=UPI0014722635|nr:transporter substrate-binding domain-containing protein [Methylobrevis pamukkalensis]
MPRLIDPGLVAAEQPARPGVIRFVTSDDFPPFNFTDGGGRLIGYNVELARTLCRQAAVACTIQVRPFEELAGALAANEADAAIAGLADTAAARETLAFTQPYLRLPARFVTRTSFAGDAIPETLSGFAVGVVTGSRYEDYLRDFFPGSRRIGFVAQEEALAALASEKVDAVFGDSLSLGFWLTGPAAKGCCRLAGAAYVETAYFPGALRIAVRREDRDLAVFLDAALVRLDQQQRLDDLYRRFFPVGIY